MTEYSMAVESFNITYPQMEPLYREHYAEMCARLEENGQKCSPYNPRLDEYRKAAEAGTLITIILRCHGAAVGYCNVYVTNDMHNHDRIALEDTVFVTKAHRRGIGKKLVLFGIDRLRERGVKRLMVSSMTDLRMEKLWMRLGFKRLAVQMVYQFEVPNVPV
jgi:GNAT superfamily N-acetyltransferase